MVTILLLWVLWCLLHSLLIHSSVKRRLCSLHPALTGAYRLCYSLFALLSLLPVAALTLVAPQTVVFDFSGPWRILQAVLLLYAALMFYGGARAYDMDFFLGIRQWNDYRAGKPPGSQVFHDRGVLQRVRHPWYSGGIVLLWAMGPLTTVNLPVRLLLTGYFLVGTVLEERRLKRQLGHPYRDYCRRVPMLFPWR